MTSKILCSWCGDSLNPSSSYCRCGVNNPLAKMAKPKNAKKKVSRTSPENIDLELVGGIYVVERYKDGTERREEIDGKLVLNLLLLHLEQYLDTLTETR